MTGPNRSGRGERRQHARGNRRGATLILFAALTVPLLLIAAMAIDMSQMQVGTNQIQTAADAAALAGARGAQLYPGTASTTAPTYAQAAASANTAFTASVNVNASDVEPIYFDPSNSSVTPSSWGGTYNGVRVTVQTTAPRIFSRLMWGSDQTITRKGVAWIANVNGGSCLKPWALPYTILYDAVVSATGITSTLAPTSPSTNPPYRNNLSQAQIAAMDSLTRNNLNVTQRTIILRGPNTETANFPVSANPASLPSGNQWYGYNYDGNAGNSYQGEIGNCTASASVGINSGTTLPGGGTDYECWTITAIAGGSTNACNNSNYLTTYSCNGGGTQGCPTYRTCSFREMTNANNQTVDAGCYDPTLYRPVCQGQGSNCSITVPVAAVPGVMSTVAWGDGTGNGSNLTSYRQVGQFKIVCVFRYFSQGNGQRTSVDSKVVHETCQVPNGSLYTDLPHGTLVGVIETVGAPKLGNGVTLGNAPALGQRLILVQ